MPIDRTISLQKLKEIADVVMHAASADTLEEALQRIAHATRELVHAKYAALGVPDGEGGLTHFKVSGLSPAEIKRIDHPPIGRGLLGAIMNEQRPIRLDHIAADARSSGFPEGHPTMDRFLGVPIQAGDVLFGMLYLTDREDGQSFTTGDQWLVEAMAGYAALAIAGMQLRDKNHRLTLLEERQRIGMELHDGIIQSLYALGMHLDLIRVQEDIPATTFQPVINGLNTVIEEIRTYIMDLRRHDEAARTCHELIEDVVNRLYIPGDMTIIINAPHRPFPLDQRDAESVCMIVREALSNAVRHARANQVTISAWHHPDYLRIVVTDDGDGFDPDSLYADDGLGVRNMRERAHLHGGTLAIDTAAQQGTTITLDVPLDRTADKSSMRDGVH